MDDPSKHTEAQNQVRYADMITSVTPRENTLYDFPCTEAATHTLEDMRKREFEAWMDDNGFHLVTFPTNCDIPYADSTKTASRCFTLYRTASSTRIAAEAMKAYTDSDLLRYLYAYETASRLRRCSTLDTSAYRQTCTPLIHPSLRGSIQAKTIILQILSAS